MSKPFRPVMDRIQERITVTAAGCWEYPCRNGSGYGVIGLGGRGGKTARTHRVVYEALVGPIPEGLDIDHLCRNRSCCNPQHLEPVTRQVNAQRGLRKTEQTHCKQGHALSGNNLKITEKQRICLTCARTNSRESHRRRRALKKEQAA